MQRQAGQCGIYVLSLSPYPAASSGSVQVGSVVAYTNGKFNPRFAAASRDYVLLAIERE